MTEAELQQLFQRATLLYRQEPEQAARCCLQILAAAPDHFQSNHLLGVIHFGQGRMADAVSCYDRALGVQPREVDLLYNRGNALFALNRLDEALVSFDRALALAPGFAPSWNNRGNVLTALARFDEAVASYDRVLMLDPSAVEVRANRANLLFTMGRFEDALADFNGLLQRAPNSHAFVRRGDILRALRRPLEALQSYESALAIRPDDAQAWNGRGVLMLDMGRANEALADLTRALAIQPDDAQALFNRGGVVGIEMGDYVAAIPDVERALALDPALPFARGMLLRLRQHVCDWQDFASEVARINVCVRSGEKVIEPLIYAAVSESPADLQAAAVIYTAHAHPGKLALWRPRHHDKIRLGYLSADFREHATAHLMAELFELHDRDKFEIFAFDNTSPDSSSMRRRLEAAFDFLVPIRALCDAAAAQAISDAQIDILVNINGYCGDARMGVSACRPAPVQVNYLGFPGTLGAEYIDYILADSTVVPDADKHHYTEQVVTLPDCYQVNDRKRAIATIVPERSQCGLPQAAFVFCNFNAHHKFTPQSFDTWMRILTKIEGSVLWLLESNPAATKNLRREAAKHNVAGERLIFAPRMAPEQNLARLKLADLFLDMGPYNAHTTASDALWAGLPLITLCGTAFAGRVVASLLRAIGMPDLVAQTLEGYEAMALRLARDPALLREAVERLARNRTQAPLFDTPRFVHHIEDAYVTMWERFQSGERPSSFCVT